MLDTDFAFEGKTAAEWREAAADCRARSAESFARCDTDGFLSQWAMDTLANRYREYAEIAERGGRAVFTALADLDGNILDARNVETRYGWAWAVTTADGSTAWFNESEARTAEVRTRNNARKGFAVVIVEADARIRRRDGRVLPALPLHEDPAAVNLGVWEDAD